MTEEQINNLNRDIVDINEMLNHAKRDRTKNVLSRSLRQLEIELINALSGGEEVHEPSVPGAMAAAVPQTRIQIKLTQFAWDQSEKYVKIYVTLKNVHLLPKDRVYCDLNERSMELHVQNLYNKDYILTINRLLDAIIIKECHWRLKTDMVIIYLAKANPEMWSHVTDTECKCEQKRKSKKAAARNMQYADGLQNTTIGHLRTMYVMGNSDLKKAITKAWFEEKQRAT